MQVTPVNSSASVTPAQGGSTATPAGSAPAIPTSASSTSPDDSSRSAATSAGAGAGVWQQWLFGYGVGRLYDATIGPWLRQSTEAMLGRPKTPAYVPPNTPGFLARDMVSGIAGFLVGQNAFNFLNRVMTRGAGNSANLLTTSGGLSGAQAAAGHFGMAAFQRLAGQTIIMTMLFTALDAVFANFLGPKVESGVNGMFGLKVKATAKTSADGTIPQNLMRVDSEQLARNFVRNVLGGITYSTTLATIGASVARMAISAVPGPGGALLGALGSAFTASLVCGVVDAVVGAYAANVAQGTVRAVKKRLGKKLSVEKSGDVISVMGDQVSGTVKGVVVPFVVATMANQQAAFIRGLAPPPR